MKAFKLLIKTLSQPKQIIFRRHHQANHTTTEVRLRSGLTTTMPNPCKPLISLTVELSACMSAHACAQKKKKKNKEKKSQLFFVEYIEKDVRPNDFPKDCMMVRWSLKHLGSQTFICLSCRKEQMKVCILFPAIHWPIRSVSLEPFQDLFEVDNYVSLLLFPASNQYLI